VRRLLGPLVRGVGDGQLAPQDQVRRQTAVRVRAVVRVSLYTTDERSAIGLGVGLGDIKDREAGG
jgi:hypothetical protein